MSNVIKFLSQAEQSERLFLLSLDVMTEHSNAQSAELRAILVERIKRDPQLTSAAIRIAAETFIGE